MRPTRGQRIAAWLFSGLLVFLSFNLTTGAVGTDGRIALSVAMLFVAMALALWALAPKRLDE